MGHVKPDQISQGLCAAWAPLILTACLQDVFLRPGLAFQQLLHFQHTRLVVYSLCNWCRFRKRKYRVPLTRPQVILQTPWWPWRSRALKSELLNMYLSTDGSSLFFPCSFCSCCSILVLFRSSAAGLRGEYSANGALTLEMWEWNS